MGELLLAVPSAANCYETAVLTAQDAFLISSVFCEESNSF